MSTTLLQCQQIYGGKYEVNAYLNPPPESVYLNCQKIFQLSSTNIKEKVYGCEHGVVAYLNHQLRAFLETVPE